MDLDEAGVADSSAKNGGAGRRRAAFLDRDGVINRVVPDPVSGLPESPLSPDVIELVPGVARAIRRLRDRGWIVVCVTNQPAAAKGRISVADVLEIHGMVAALLAREGAAWDGSRICLHHPDGVVPELALECQCRKPRPGMLVDAASEYNIDMSSSWMIGDTDADVGVGRAAGVRTVLVANPDSSHKRSDGLTPDSVVRDLVHAVSVLESPRVATAE